jgi:hypothetical protein
MPARSLRSATFVEYEFHRCSPFIVMVERRSCGDDIMKILAKNLKVGDVVMPPAREVRLWMSRSCRDRGLPESALYLTITLIRESEPDVRGDWLWIEADQAPEWHGNVKPYPFKFKARPETPWLTIKQAA